MLKNILHLFVSNFGLKINALLFSFIIAHWQGASFLGAMYLFISIQAFGLVLAKLGLFFTLEKKLSEKGINKGVYLSSALIINLGLLTIVILILVIFSEWINDYIGIDHSNSALIFSIAFGNLINFTYPIIKSNLNFSLFSKLQFQRDFLFRILTIILLFFVDSIEVVLVAKVVVELLIAVVSLKKVLNIKIVWCKPSMVITKELIRLLRYNSILELRAITFSYIDIWMINYFLGDYFVGLYQLAWQISTALLMIGKSIINVLFPYFSKWASIKDFNKIEKFSNITIAVSLLIPIPAFVLTLMYSEYILSFFGEEFQEASYVLVILLAGSIFRPLQEITSKLLVSISMENISYWISVFSGFLNIVLNFICIPQYGIEGAAFATTLSNVVIALVGIIYIQTKSKLKLSIIKSIKSNIIATIIMLLVISIIPDIIPIYGLMLSIFIWIVIITFIEYKERRVLISDFITRSLRK
ncbi:polysaccharide biosynthesis C-terminal domain-containing protein [Gracilibacillus phocaeensis]|uniref:lipid II flippase MurJ n=1 Tax=Gracilibacillus phocaeensis TaxID=2042304 RepID=UPI001031DDC8|nr:polysaccharide biosynthesis C-terminal domain-containing protein [Gracilibacillus phocaeensis]